jgi:hypothetical protein
MFEAAKQRTHTHTPGTFRHTVTPSWSFSISSNLMWGCSPTMDDKGCSMIHPPPYAVVTRSSRIQRLIRAFASATWMRDGSPRGSAGERLAVARLIHVLHGPKGVYQLS